MTVFEIFSKRKKKERGEFSDVYDYEDIPNKLRVQCVHIIEDAVGENIYGYNESGNFYKVVSDNLCREYGIFELIKNERDKKSAVLNFILQEHDVEKVLDAVELIFKYINVVIRNNYDYRNKTIRKIEPDDAIEELNIRFKESSIGFQFVSNEIIRVDSEILHVEAVKPLLTLLHGSEYSGPNEEFLSAHENYRHGRHKECLVDSLKAFESTMKTICKNRKWSFKPTDTAKTLISVCFDNGLLPPYLESQFSSIRSVFESGVPTLRNKNAGHGQGDELVVVPQYMARYVLNMAATSMLFLIEANNSKPE